MHRRNRLYVRLHAIGSERRNLRQLTPMLRRDTGPTLAQRKFTVAFAYLWRICSVTPTHDVHIKMESVKEIRFTL